MDFDVIVAGAGPAGCIAARELAGRGFSVGLFEAEGRSRMGQSIIVEVERSCFSRAGIEAPHEAEVAYHPTSSRVFSARKVEAFRWEGVPPLAIRLDRLVRRLVDQAEAVGTRFFDGYRVQRALQEGDRICGALFEHRGNREEVRARLVIDATGFKAALVRSLDPELDFAFRDELSDCVHAANYLHDIDPERAVEAIHSGLQAAEETWVWLGTAGPYSTICSHLSLRKNCAYVLVGQKADYRGPPVEQVAQEHRKAQGYFGKKIVGGRGPIRVTRPLDRLVCNGFLVIGEAARMVTPINGSGVGNALTAARLAAAVATEALSEGEPTAESLWAFARQFQRTEGASLAALDAIRLTVESLTDDQVADLLESGLSGPEDMTNAARGLPLSLSPLTLPRRLRALASHPELIKPLARMAVAVAEIRRLYRKYPATADPQALASWSKQADHLFSPWRLPSLG